MDDPSTQTTLNIPSLVAFAVISFFAIRYFFFSPSSSSSSTASSHTSTGSSSTSRQRRTFPPDRVETVSAMFPQLNRRDVEYDLVRNGGSAQATTERVLREGRLPAAPANFQPVYAAPPLAAAAAAGRAGAGGSSRGAPKKTYEDLITRYNLSSKVGVGSPVAKEGEGGVEGVAGGAGAGAGEEVIQSSEKQKAKGGWSANKNERQDLLRRRREEMVLAARRKMEERDRKGKDKAT